MKNELQLIFIFKTKGNAFFFVNLLNGCSIQLIRGFWNTNDKTNNPFVLIQ